MRNMPRIVICTSRPRGISNAPVVGWFAGVPVDNRRRVDVNDRNRSAWICAQRRGSGGCVQGSRGGVRDSHHFLAAPIRQRLVAVAQSAVDRARSHQ